MGCSPLKRARREKFTQWAENEEEALNELCAFLELGEHFSSCPMFCRAKGFTYRMLKYWLDQDEERLASVEDAKRVCADKKAARALMALEECSGEVSSQVQLARSKFDAYKWAAEMTDRSAYGNKVETTIKGSKEDPLSVLLSEISSTGNKLQPSQDGFDDEE